MPGDFNTFKSYDCNIQAPGATFSSVVHHKAASFLEYSLISMNTSSIP